MKATELLWINHFTQAWHFPSLHWKDDMEDEQFTLTNMHSNEKLSQPSSQLPLGKVSGGHICPGKWWTYMPSSQKGATAGWILQDAEQTSQELGQAVSFRVVWRRGKQGGCIQAVSGYDRWHPNQRNKPKTSTTPKGRQGAGEWQVSSEPGANRNRSINRAGCKQSEEVPEQWLRTPLLPPLLAFIFQGHKDTGSRKMRWEHVSAALWPACPHAPVTLPTRIPQYSCNLGHYSFSKMFTRDSSNGQSLQCATFPR